MKKGLYNIFKKKFSFIFGRFGLQLCEEIMQKDYWKLFFKNENVAVTVLYEFREAYVFVKFHKLIGGQVEKAVSPYSVGETTVFNTHSLDDIVFYRAPNKVMKPMYDEAMDYYNRDNGFVMMIDEIANRIENYANDVLKGDFGIFLSLDKIVRDRCLQWQKESGNDK